jgi:hypothetical protein
LEPIILKLIFYIIPAYDELESTETPKAVTDHEKAE